MKFGITPEAAQYIRANMLTESDSNMVLVFSPHLVHERQHMKFSTLEEALENGAKTLNESARPHMFKWTIGLNVRDSFLKEDVVVVEGIALGLTPDSRRMLEGRTLIVLNERLVLDPEPALFPIALDESNGNVSRLR